jgi:hypothetical protein
MWSEMSKGTRTVQDGMWASMLRASGAGAGSFIRTDAPGMGLDMRKAQAWEPRPDIRMLITQLPERNLNDQEAFVAALATATDINIVLLGRSY